MKLKSLLRLEIIISSWSQILSQNLWNKLGLANKVRSFVGEVVNIWVLCLLDGHWICHSILFSFNHLLKVFETSWFANWQNLLGLLNSWGSGTRDGWYWIQQLEKWNTSRFCWARHFLIVSNSLSNVSFLVQVFFHLVSRARRNEPTIKGTILFDANSTIALSPVNFQ